MNLTPQRKPGEPFRLYKLRRAAENEAVKHYLRGRLVRTMIVRPKYGKAETKRLKRERQRARQAQ